MTTRSKKKNSRHNRKSKQIEKAVVQTTNPFKLFGFGDLATNWHFGIIGLKMNIPIVDEDGNENEVDIEMCCAECANKAHQWTPAQFNKVLAAVEKNEPIKVPINIDSDTKFAEFIKSL